MKICRSSITKDPRLNTAKSWLMLFLHVLIYFSNCRDKTKTKKVVKMSERHYDNIVILYLNRKLCYQ